MVRAGRGPRAGPRVRPCAPADAGDSEDGGDPVGPGREVPAPESSRCPAPPLPPASPPQPARAHPASSARQAGPEDLRRQRRGASEPLPGGQRAPTGPQRGGAGKRPGPGPCGPVAGASVLGSKGPGFEPHPGHVPGLQAWAPPHSGCLREEAANPRVSHIRVSLPLPLPSTLSKNPRSAPRRPRCGPTTSPRTPGASSCRRCPGRRRPAARGPQGRRRAAGLRRRKAAGAPGPERPPLRPGSSAPSLEPRTS